MLLLEVVIIVDGVVVAVVVVLVVPTLSPPPMTGTIEYGVVVVGAGVVVVGCLVLDSGTVYMEYGVTVVGGGSGVSIPPPPLSPLPPPPPPRPIIEDEGSNEASTMTHHWLRRASEWYRMNIFSSAFCSGVRGRGRLVGTGTRCRTIPVVHVIVGDVFWHFGDAGRVCHFSCHFIISALSV